MDDDGDYDISFSNRDNDQPKKLTTNLALQKKIPTKHQEYDVQTQKQVVGYGFGTNDFSLSRAANPSICIATISFKISSFVLYILGNIAPVLFFIFIAILSTLDFWTVKNVSGRLLVGLRWWTDYDENGNQKWKFESPDKQFKANSVDKAFFWTSQILFTILWGLILILKILTLSIFWGMLVFLNFFLCLTNLYGFYKCSGDHSKKLKNLQGQAIKGLAGKIF